MQNDVEEPLLSELSDEKLVEASRAGDKEAYAVLANRYYERVFVTCLGMLGKVHDAEDITQDAMLRGLIRIGTLRDSCQFGSWIVRIARNYCVSNIRRRRYVGQFVGRKSASPDKDLAPYEDLQRAIAKLPPESRLPLVTYYFGGESVQDVAEKLELSRSAVYQRLRTATKQLHKLLTKQGDVL
jgi:RNA polymerase sigma-70 factor (ECF subfamily)